MSALLNARELCAALGISERTYYRLQPTGAFRMFQTSRPMGQRKFSAALVQRYLAGQSVVPIGTGSRRDRRTA